MLRTLENFLHLSLLFLQFHYLGLPTTFLMVLSWTRGQQSPSFGFHKRMHIVASIASHSHLLHLPLDLYLVIRNVLLSEN